MKESFFEAASDFTTGESEPGAVEFAEVKELNHIIQLTVSRLPPKCQEIFRLSREENLSNKEIARQLGISTKTVENQITIALHRIRANVKQPLFALTLVPFLY